MRQATRRLVMLCLALALAVLASAPRGYAYPEPTASSRAWQFEFTHSKPVPISFKGSDGVVRWYWYMTYKVVNNSGDERLFVPEFAIATDQGDLVNANQKVPAGVFEAVKDRAGIPLLKNPIRVVGRLLQGEDNAQESVAIWQAFEHDVDRVSVFVAGLSGETQSVKNPVTNEDVSVRKTLMIDYAFPGTGGRVQDQTVLPKGEKWIMR